MLAVVLFGPSCDSLRLILRVYVYIYVPYIAACGYFIVDFVIYRFCLHL